MNSLEHIVNFKLKKNIIFYKHVKENNHNIAKGIISCALLLINYYLLIFENRNLISPLIIYDCFFFFFFYSKTPLAS
jgi:hypothetical protein